MNSDQFPIHNRKTAIEKLPCNLPNEQTVLFEESNVADEGPPTTKLTDYFLLTSETHRQELFYIQISHSSTHGTQENACGNDASEVPAMLIT